MKLKEWIDRISGDESLIQFQAHDFSFRGMSGLEDACVSGISHLTSFLGPDTLPAADLSDADINNKLS